MNNLGGGQRWRDSFTLTRLRRDPAAHPITENTMSTADTDRLHWQREEDSRMADEDNRRGARPLWLEAQSANEDGGEESPGEIPGPNKTRTNRNQEYDIECS